MARLSGAELAKHVELAIIYSDTSREKYISVLQKSFGAPKASTEFIYSSLLSVHCILNMFEENKGATITKRKAYNAYEVWFAYFYGDLLESKDPATQETATELKNSKNVKHPSVNASSFGKLIKKSFSERVQTKRVGSRLSSSYYYTNISFKDGVDETLNRLKSTIKRVTFIKPDIRFNPLKYNVNSSIMDAQFKRFFKQEQLFHTDDIDFTTDGNVIELRTSSKDLDLPSKIRGMNEVLFKSNQLLNNLLSSVLNKNEVFEIMREDWYEINIENIVIECLPDLDFPTGFFSLLTAFPDLLEKYQKDIINMRNQSEFNLSSMLDFTENDGQIDFLNNISQLVANCPHHYTTPSDKKHTAFKGPFVNRVFKFDVLGLLEKENRNSPLIAFKVGVTDLLLTILFYFPKIPLNKILLNFKFITTKILTELTRKNRQSFSSYWILSCFITEYFTFLIEFYCHKRSLMRLATKKSK